MLELGSQLDLLLEQTQVVVPPGTQDHPPSSVHTTCMTERASELAKTGVRSSYQLAIATALMFSTIFEVGAVRAVVTYVQNTCWPAPLTLHMPEVHWWVAGLHAQLDVQAVLVSQ